MSLDSPIWDTLQHAYGSAEGIPGLLREIAVEPDASSASEGPWFDLWSALCHQGDVYPASFAAVPHIVQALADHIECACDDFFLLPASIEWARSKHGVHVPTDLLALTSNNRLDRIAGRIFGEPGRESMVSINKLHFVLARQRIAQAHS